MAYSVVGHSAPAHVQASAPSIAAARRTLCRGDSEEAVWRSECRPAPPQPTYCERCRGGSRLMRTALITSFAHTHRVTRPSRRTHVGPTQIAAERGQVAEPPLDRSATRQQPPPEPVGEHPQGSQPMRTRIPVPAAGVAAVGRPAPASRVGPGRPAAGRAGARPSVRPVPGPRAAAAPDRGGPRPVPLRQLLEPTVLPYRRVRGLGPGHRPAVRRGGRTGWCWCRWRSAPRPAWRRGPSAARSCCRSCCRWPCGWPPGRPVDPGRQAGRGGGGAPGRPGGQRVQVAARGRVDAAGGAAGPVGEVPGPLFRLAAGLVRPAPGPHLIRFPGINCRLAGTRTGRWF